MHVLGVDFYILQWLNLGEILAYYFVLQNYRWEKKDWEPVKPTTFGSMYYFSVAV